MKRFKWICLYTFLIFFGMAFTLIACQDPFRVKTLFFYVPDKTADLSSILINDQPLVSLADNTYEPLTLNSLYPVQVNVNGRIKSFSLKHLNRYDYFRLIVRDKDKWKTYKIKTVPTRMPSYKTTRFDEHALKGYVLTTFMTQNMTHPSYAVMLDTDGSLVYYQSHEQPNMQFFNFRRWVLPSGQIRYSYFKQNKQTPTLAYYPGVTIVMDERFKPLYTIDMVSSTKYPNAQAEMHDFLLLDENHSITLGYAWERFKNPNAAIPTPPPYKLMIGLIQEQKNGHILLDWKGTDYPDFLTSGYEGIPQPGDAFWKDYMHLNGLAVDPADQHIVVSSATNSALFKIHRQTGQILWRLNGKMDDFHLKGRERFVRQHHPTYLPDGSLLLFDNGRASWIRVNKDKINADLGSGPTRLLRLWLDDKNKKLIKYKDIIMPHTAIAMGSAQWINDDLYFAGLGNAHYKQAVLVNAKGDLLFSLTLKPPYVTYRAYFIPKTNF